MKRWLRRSVGYTSSVLLAMVLFIGLTACSPVPSDGKRTSNGSDENSGQTTSKTADSAAATSGKASLASQAKEDVSRKIIYKADLEMPVKEYNTAQSKLRELVAASGGYILDFNESTSNSQISGTFTIKIAAGEFSSLLDQLETISPSMQRSVKGQDVSEEYVDLTARLKAKQTVEARLLSFMEKATKSDELLAYSTELGKVQEEIERIKGRKNFLDQNVAYSTIQLRMYQNNNPAPVNPNKDTFGNEIANAFTSSIKGVLTFLKGLVVVLTSILPAIVLIAIIVIPCWIWIRKINKRKRLEMDLRYQNMKDNAADVIQSQEGEEASDNQTDDQGSSTQDMESDKDKMDGRHKGDASKDN
ncbi:DUF4349 domain-containing protein [Paenibacillus sp. KN14-4R]|uniref:DUF4349 domain-containing protein n=1 Tax=Paenibacillus sp. KN14-4R TaxID=3445773 RepID=UPI003FA09962